MEVDETAGTDMWDGRVIEKMHYPVVLVINHGKEIHFSLHYDAAGFSDGWACGVLDHLCAALSEITNDESARLTAISVLTAAERQQLLVEWNDTKLEYAREKCVHELFEEQAAQRPEAVAVVFEENPVSYD